MGKAIRDVYGEALARHGAANEKVVVLDADVSSSTKTALFAAVCPQRFFNVGIAEANMVGMAAGFAATGHIPFVNSFSVFLSTLGLLGARAFGSYSGLNIKLMGAYSGVSDAFDGPSHHSVEDIAIMRSLPGFEVYVASDEYQTDWLVRHAIETPGPMFIRLSRDATRTLYAPDTHFDAERGQVVREGGDVTLIACGVMVGQALAAAKQLEAEGISARVVDMFRVKPIDAGLITEAARETGAIVTAEEHSVIGGLGGAVAEALAAGDTPAPLEMVGLRDCHAECGPYARLLEKYGLGAGDIAAAAKRAMARKKAEKKGVF